MIVLLELSSVALATSRVMTGPSPAILMLAIVWPADDAAALAAALGVDAVAALGADDAAAGAALVEADGAADEPHAAAMRLMMVKPTAARATDGRRVPRLPMLVRLQAVRDGARPGPA